MRRVAAETSSSSVGGANSALPWKGSPRKPIESSYPAPIRSASPISPRYHCSAAWSIVHGTRSRPGRPWRRPGADRHREHGRSTPTSAASSRVPAPAARTTAAAGDPVRAEPDARDAAALGHDVRRPRVGQDAAAAIADAREEARDAIGGIGVAAVRLPRRGADAVGLHEREEPLHARRRPAPRWARPSPA